MKTNRILALFFVILGANQLLAQPVDRFAPIRQFLSDSVEKQQVAGGCVLVVHKGKRVFQSGFGFTNLKTKDPFSINTPVVIASISKPLLGTTLYRLAKKGDLQLDRPISDYLKEFSNRKLESGAALTCAPTLTELLTHTSGIRNDEAKGGRIWFQKWTQGKSLGFVVNKIANEFHFKTQPGTNYAYCGIGTDVAARVGEVVSDLPRNEMLVKWVAQPLEMTKTFYKDRSGIQTRNLKMPMRYYRDKKSGELAARKKRALPESNQYSASGGSVISTAEDLLKWLSMIKNGGILPNGERFLSAESMELMLKKQSGSYNARGGLFVRRTDKSGKPVKYAHTGSSGTSVWIDLESDVIGIILTQTRASDIKKFRLELEKKITKIFSDVSP